jgi:flagellar FliJ protein
VRKFNFNLQKVLNLRKYKEEECKIALGQAIGILTGIENRIKETAIMRHDARQKQFSDTANLLSWNNFITRLDQSAEKLAKDAARAELVVEEKRAAFLEASRDVKALEKLKEKREKEYRKKMFAAQASEMDSNFNARRPAAGIL